MLTGDVCNMIAIQRSDWLMHLFIAAISLMIGSCFLITGRRSDHLFMQMWCRIARELHVKLHLYISKSEITNKNSSPWLFILVNRVHRLWKNLCFFLTSFNSKLLNDEWQKSLFRSPFNRKQLEIYDLECCSFRQSAFVWANAVISPAVGHKKRARLLVQSCLHETKSL